MKATLLAALSIGTITKSSLRENIVFLSSCSLKIDFTVLHVISEYPPDRLQNSNCGYPDYTKFNGLGQREEDDEEGNISRFEY